MSSVKYLKKDSGGLYTGIFQGLAYVAPAATAASFFVVEAGYVGASIPLTFILATLGVASAMYMNYTFAKRISHAGGYYSYISAGLGGRLGGFGALLYYTNVMGALVGFSTLFFAGVAWPLVPQLASNPYGWIPLALIPLVLIFTLLYFGLKPSLYYTLIGGVIEVTVLVAFSLYIIFSPSTSNSFIPFTLNGNSAGNLGFGTLYAVLGFVGLGSIITISEELKTPKKIVPKAIVYGLIIGAVVYIISAYAMVVGWGIGNIGTFATSTNPGFTIMFKYLGPIGVTVFILITLNSFISNGIAEGNAFSRIGFGMARDNLVLPKSMAVADKKTGSPRRIVLFEAAFVTSLSLISGLIFGPFIGSCCRNDAKWSSSLYCSYSCKHFPASVWKEETQTGFQEMVTIPSWPYPCKRHIHICNIWNVHSYSRVSNQCCPLPVYNHDNRWHIICNLSYKKENTKGDCNDRQRGSDQGQ